MKIGVICAMPQEIAALIAHLENKTQHTTAGVKIYEGTIGQHELILCQSGIGKVQAALTATLLAQIPGIDAIINTGSAGGIGQDLKIGEVVVSTEVAFTDVDVTASGYPMGQMPGQPQKFTADETLAEKIVAAAQASDLQVTTGLIVSGDQFVSSEARIKEILGLYPTALANEMEGAAIGQVAHQFKVPFVVIRALSDTADSNAAVNFDDFIEAAGKQSARMLLNFLK